MITIDELMTPNPYTLKTTDPVDTAWEIMTEKRIRHIPIIDDKEQVVGLVTQRDVLAASKPISSVDKNHEIIDPNFKMTVSDIMIDDVVTIHPSESLRQAGLYMQSHKHGCLPVVLKNRLIGIITDSDFITIAINLLEQSELQEQITEDEDFFDTDL